MKLRSQKPSDVLLGMREAEQWLNENPEEWDVYGTLLDAVKETPELRDQVRSLLIEMMQKGSNAAQKALSIIPSSVKDLLADADDAYYAGEYEQAMQLYRQVLRLDPQNARAREQLSKPRSDYPTAEDLKTGIPRDAVQYYRRARSYIAARDYLHAIRSLSAAIESAQVRGVTFIEAEQLLSTAQDSQIAEEFKEKAKHAQENRHWAEALDLYTKALRLENTDEAVKKEIRGLQGLLRAESELRNRGVLKIFAPLGKLQKAWESAKGVVNPDDPLLNFVEKQLNQIRMIRIGGIIAILVLVGFVFFSFWGEKFELFELHGTTTLTPTSALTGTFAITTSETPTQIASPIPTASVTDTPTVTATYTPESTFTPVPLGYGILNSNTYPLEEPDGKQLGYILYRKQPVTMWESRISHSFTWYRCSWVVNGIPGEGWILGRLVDELEITPTPSP
jgi:tetratricopeptide (TPR) repeat protein